MLQYYISFILCIKITMIICIKSQKTWGGFGIDEDRSKNLVRSIRCIKKIF